MALTDSLNLVVLVNNSQRALLTEATVNGQSGRNAIETLEGLAGFSDGPKRLELDIQEAVLLGSTTHLDTIDACAEGVYVDVQVPAGVRSIISRGIWESFTLGQSTGDGTKFSGKFIGELTKTK